MADNTYTIYIRLDGLEESKSVAGEGVSSTGADSVGNNSSAQGAASAVKKIVSFAAATSTADKLITYNISQISLRTGATEYEQRLNTSYSFAKQTLGAGAALAGAAIFGGPTAFTVAAVGLVSAGINKLLGIAQKQATLQAEQHLEDISIGMQNVRAGTLGRRSTD